jgi:hypothetical protein
VTKRFFVANVARAAIDESSASSTGVSVGNSTYDVGWPIAVVFSVDAICQTRLRAPSATRPETSSDVIGVTCFVKALPAGFSAEIGTRTASISFTTFAMPSTVMSSRAENRCW